MATPVKLTKADVRRALVRHHFSPFSSQLDVFERLRSIQFDPIAPVGCNHDLVLQARLADYQIGDWQTTAYQDRQIYDGWDKQASLIPFEGWPVRRIFHRWAQTSWAFLREHQDAAQAVLAEIRDRGAMQPKDFELQERKHEWEGSWYGPSLTKNVLRRLWNTGQVMTAGRRKGQHLYDLSERVVPPEFYNAPDIDEETSIREIVLERHRAMGFLRLSPPPEVWASNIYLSGVRNPAIKALAEEGTIVPVEVEGIKGHATPAFLNLLDEPSIEPRMIFVAPLDQILWDRKAVQHLFNFEYIWEIYTPEAKRRWGYYVLPILFGDQFVGRVEFWARGGILEVRQWHWESGQPTSETLEAIPAAITRFKHYSSTKKVKLATKLKPDLARLLRV